MMLWVTGNSGGVMDIKNDVIISETKEDIVSVYEDALKLKYGANFRIKKDGILYSIINLAVESELELQDNIMKIADSFNPHAVTGFRQDAMYERLGIYRLAPVSTKFFKNIISDFVCSVKAGEICIRSSSNGKEFFNVNSFTTDISGVTQVEFKAVECGLVEVSACDVFNIVYAPTGISAVSESPAVNISFGSDKETDEDYKKRYQDLKFLNARATYSANISNLKKYTHEHIKIFDKNTKRSLDEGVVEIIAKYDVSDIQFASAIANTFGTGILFVGTTEVILNDIAGTTYTVRFTKAQDVPVVIKLVLRLMTGYLFEEIRNIAQAKIMQYLEDKYTLGSVIYANELIIPVLQIDGVETVTDIQIKRENDESYSQTINLSDYELPVFTAQNIQILEEV